MLLNYNIPDVGSYLTKFHAVPGGFLLQKSVKLLWKRQNGSHLYKKCNHGCGKFCKKDRQNNEVI